LVTTEGIFSYPQTVDKVVDVLSVFYEPVTETLGNPGKISH